MRSPRLFRPALALLALLAACGGRSPHADGPPRAGEGASDGDARVEKHTTVEKTPTGTRTVTVTTTTRVVEPPSPPARPADPYPSDARVKHNVERLNAYRAAAHVPPLLYDAKISAFALEGSRELSKSHVAHAHFAREESKSSAFGPRSAENQGDPSGVPPMAKDVTESGKKQIDLLLKLMFDEGPGGGHHDNMLNPKYRRVGVGLYDDGDRMYLTNDFSD